MKLTESKLRKLIREELISEISKSRLESAISGYRISNVTVHGDTVSIVVSDGRTSKALTIEGNPEFKIERI